MSHMPTTGGPPLPTSGGILLSFPYVVTGLEGGDTFPIVFPTALANTNWIAQLTLLDSVGPYTVNAPMANYLTTGITAVCGQVPAVGDVIGVVIQARTS